MQDFERSYIAAAINKTSTLTEAAELLDINLTTLNRKKAQLGIYKQWKK
jgi:DNA-binding NtrC family response regulator